MLMCFCCRFFFSFPFPHLKRVWGSGYDRVPGHLVLGLDPWDCSRFRAFVPMLPTTIAWVPFTVGGTIYFCNRFSFTFTSFFSSATHFPLRLLTPPQAELPDWPFLGLLVSVFFVFLLFRWKSFFLVALEDENYFLIVLLLLFDY